ncbi:hypothetical protein L9F63_001034, partial [Diploptera punctata]
CSWQKDCVKCDNGDYGTRRCNKCSRLIVLGSRQCVDKCPSGYREDWSRFASYMGRICYETGYLGLPGRTLAIVVGTATGAAICMGILLGGFLYLKHRRHTTSKSSSYSSDSVNDSHHIHDSPERREFLKHLAALRCDAPVFLAMLNDTRRQVRELYHSSGRSDTAIQAYRPVLTDLARILMLLNRPEHLIESPPSNWEKLLAWGERVLRRYKKQNPHQVAQAQLISFLQVPIQTNHSSTSSLYRSPESNHRALTTFQPVTSNSSETNKYNSQNNQTQNHSIQEMAISAFDSNYSNGHITGGERRDATMLQTSLIDSDFNPSWEFNPANCTVLAEWSASRDYLFEDDFFTLGFRPQDEITTEL